jgi:hypothetical protein
VTFFDSLFLVTSVRRRHYTAPPCKERVAFLSFMLLLDRKFNTIQVMASPLPQINRTLGFSKTMHVSNGFDSRVNSPSMYSKRNHGSTFFGTKVYSRGFSRVESGPVCRKPSRAVRIMSMANFFSYPSG